MSLNLKQIFLTKKSIQPIILVILLIFIFIIIFTYIYSWFNYNLTDYQTNFEIQTNNNFVYIEGFSNNTLVIKNLKESFLELKDIYIQDYQCNISGNYTNKTISINLTQCINDSVSYNTYKRVSVFFNGFILNKVLFFKEYKDCIQDGLLVVNAESNVFYNSSTAPCYNISRICVDGTLSGNSSFNYSSCS